MCNVWVVGTAARTDNPSPSIAFSGPAMQPYLLLQLMALVAGQPSSQSFCWLCNEDQQLVVRQDEWCSNSRNARALHRLGRLLGSIPNFKVNGRSIFDQILLDRTVRSLGQHHHVEAKAAAVVHKAGWPIPHIRSKRGTRLLVAYCATLIKGVPARPVIVPQVIMPKLSDYLQREKAGRGPATASAQRHAAAASSGGGSILAQPVGPARPLLQPGGLDEASVASSFAADALSAELARLQRQHANRSAPAVGPRATGHMSAVPGKGFLCPPCLLLWQHQLKLVLYTSCAAIVYTLASI